MESSCKTVTCAKSYSGKDIVLPEFDFKQQAIDSGGDGEPYTAIENAVDAQERFLDAVQELEDDEDIEEIVRFSMNELSKCLDSDY